MPILAILTWHRTDLQFTCKIILSSFLRNSFSIASLLVNYLGNHDTIKSIPNLLPYPEFKILVILGIPYQSYFSNIDFFNIVVSLFPFPRKLYFVICFLFAFMYLFIWKCATRKPPHNVSCISHIVPLMLLKLLTSSK